MAVTNMWAVKGSVSSVVDYIENPEKTTPRDMQQVMSYITVISLSVRAKLMRIPHIRSELNLHRNYGATGLRWSLRHILIPDTTIITSV